MKLLSLFALLVFASIVGMDQAPTHYIVTLGSPDNQKSFHVKKEYLERIPVFKAMLQDLPPDDTHINLENTISEPELLTLVHYLDHNKIQKKHSNNVHDDIHIINEIHDDAHILDKFELKEPLDTVVNYIARRIAKKRRLPTDGPHLYATFQDNSHINALIAGILHNKHLYAFKDHITQQSPLTELTYIAGCSFTSLATNPDASQILCTTSDQSHTPCIMLKNKGFTYARNVDASSVAFIKNHQFAFARGRRMYAYNKQNVDNQELASKYFIPGIIKKISTTPNKEKIIIETDNTGVLHVYDIIKKTINSVTFNNCIEKLAVSDTTILTYKSSNFINIDLANRARIQLWDIATSKLVGELPNAFIPKAIHALALYNNSSKKIIIAGTDGLINTLDMQTGRTIASFGKEYGPFTRLLLTPDEKKLITLSSDNTVYVFDPQAGKIICTMPNIEQPIKDFVWADDAHELILMSSNKIHAWDLSITKKLATVSLPDLVKTMKTTEHA